MSNMNGDLGNVDRVRYIPVVADDGTHLLDNIATLTLVLLLAPRPGMPHSRPHISQTKRPRTHGLYGFDERISHGRLHNAVARGSTLRHTGPLVIPFSDNVSGAAQGLPYGGFSRRMQRTLKVDGCWSDEDTVKVRLHGNAHP